MMELIGIHLRRGSDSKFLMLKWNKELDYRLVKELRVFDQNRIQHDLLTGDRSPGD